MAKEKGAEQKAYLMAFKAFACVLAAGLLLVLALVCCAVEKRMRRLFWQRYRVQRKMRRGMIRQKTCRRIPGRSRRKKESVLSFRK